MTPEVRSIPLDIAPRNARIPDRAIAHVPRILLAEMDAAALQHRQIIAVSACPECTAGKCSNCPGWALNEHTDEMVDCPCADAGHGAR